TADLGRRAHGATLGPGVLAAQMRACIVVAALTGTGALAASAAAIVASTALRLPWAPVIAAAGVAVTLVAGAFALCAPRPPRARRAPLRRGGRDLPTPRSGGFLVESLRWSCLQNLPIPADARGPSEARPPRPV